MGTDARETVSKDQALKDSMKKIDKLVIITKTAWYKEAAGVLAVITWTTLVGLWAWALLTGSRLGQWYYLLVLVVIAVISSLFRWASRETSVEKYDL